jgi:hypothetical protein
MSAVLARSADLVVRIDRGSDGPFRMLVVKDSNGSVVFGHDGASTCAARASPDFAATLRARGDGGALVQLRC